MEAPAYSVQNLAEKAGAECKAYEIIQPVLCDWRRVRSATVKNLRDGAGPNSYCRSKNLQFKFCPCCEYVVKCLG